MATVPPPASWPDAGLRAPLTSYPGYHDPATCGNEPTADSQQPAPATNSDHSRPTADPHNQHHFDRPTADPRQPPRATNSNHSRATVDPQQPTGTHNYPRMCPQQPTTPTPSLTNIWVSGLLRDVLSMCHFWGCFDSRIDHLADSHAAQFTDSRTGQLTDPRTDQLADSCADQLTDPTAVQYFGCTSLSTMLLSLCHFRGRSGAARR